MKIELNEQAKLINELYGVSEEREKELMTISEELMDKDDPIAMYKAINDMDLPLNEYAFIHILIGGMLAIILTS